MIINKVLPDKDLAEMFGVTKKRIRSIRYDARGRELRQKQKFDYVDTEEL